MEQNNYRTFTIMLIISFIIMYSIMFFNVSALDHIYLSLTRLYMALLMVSSMALLMFALMKHMYKDKKKNTLIIGSSIGVLVLSFILLRTQTPIGDVQYMKAMIPHHSSAILTSEKANIQDPEVRKLADDIIKAQKKEIAEMDAAIKRLEH